ncbi:protein NLRC5 [Erinaceus europaeus]|uniref:Protein NLRC5 n=1 Tax=Erinaceus europaeus TaxID=9365 RepID=A0ABM3WY48_ERIEU|nr:protein NLRC5 [Erinaceus europaeus]
MDPLSDQLNTNNLWSLLVTLLTKDPEWLDHKVKSFLPSMDLGFGNRDLDPTKRVTQQLNKLLGQGEDTWQGFIHCVCMELTVPLHLEAMLLSTWGNTDGLSSQLTGDKESQSESQLHQGLKRPHQNYGNSPRRKQSRKQQQGLAKRYLQQLRTYTEQCYGGRSPGSGLFPASQQAYVPPILQWSRTTTPSHTQEGVAVGALKAEDGTNISILDLFSTKTNKDPKVTVLLGEAGMGKTTLAHCLCQQWADGQLKCFQALFFFEFRQLSLIPNSMTLLQLLFDLSLSPEDDPQAIFQYLEMNAHGVLLIFDGLDEALYPCSSIEVTDPKDAGSPLDLFSGLCRGTLLPGCWVLATSRPGKLPTCLPTEAAMAHLWGFDQPRVEAYVRHFFSDQTYQEAALVEVRGSGSLLNMCAVPALCQVTCLCLQHLLPDSSPGQAAALLPTVTQSFMQMVLTLSPRRDRGDCTTDFLLSLSEVALWGLENSKVIFSAGDIHPSTMAFGATHSLLASFRVCTGPGHLETGYAFTHLSLQEFFAALYLMVSPKVDTDKLACHVTLNSRWLLRTNAKSDLSGHLTTFLAGLASSACHPFLLFLAQQDKAWVDARQAVVIQTLKKLATHKLTGPKVIELCHCVSETQDPKLASFIAQNLPSLLHFRNFLLTSTDLAALTNILGHRDAPIHLDFEGCTLGPYVPETLAGCEQVESLSFKSRKCGDAFAEALARTLPTMKNLKQLGLTGSQITAQGIHQLVQALCLCPQLEELHFQDNQLKDQEILHIVEVLPDLPQLRKLDLSRNSIMVSTLLRLTEVAVTSPMVTILQVGKTDLFFDLSPSTKTVTDPQGGADLQGNANQKGEALSRRLTLRLQECELRVHSADILIAQLRRCPHLIEVDLSGNQLEDEGCCLMAEAASQLHIIKKLNLSDNGLSVSGLHCVLSLLNTCRTLVQLDISLLQKTAIFMFSPELEEQEGTQKCYMPQRPLELSPRWIRLTRCGLQAKHLEQLCKALRGSSHLSDLSGLDFSDNALRDEGVTQLAQLLPGLGPLHSLNLSQNNLSLDALFILAQCFSVLQWVLLLDISFESQQVILRSDRGGRDPQPAEFGPDFQAGAKFLGSGLHCIPKSFCLRECHLEPQSLQRLCETLEQCAVPLEVMLSCEHLNEKTLNTLLYHLPRIPSLNLLQLSLARKLPLRSPFLLADLFSVCSKIQKVELRSLCHMSLHLKTSEEQEGRYCGFIGCDLGQEHVKTLCRLLNKCDHLSQLDLSANLLGDGGLRALLDCLPQLPISGSIDLSHNGISQESTLCLLEALPSCPRVREASVNLGPEQSFWIHFSRKEEARKTLRLSKCSFGLENMPRLATGLSQALQLTELTLTQCDLAQEQLASLLNLVRKPAGQLTLRVKEPWVGRTRMKALLEVCTQASGNITEISVSGTQKQLHIRLDFPRQENPEAVALRLAHCDLETYHNLPARELRETCAKLQQLSLSQLSLCDDSSLMLQSLLLSLSELKKFRLTSSCVSSQGLAHLASGLSHCHHLEELDFSSNEFCKEDTTVLLGALESKQRMKRLDLSYLPLGDSNLAVLTRGLNHMTLLQSLRLNSTHLEDSSCCHLSQVLGAATGLEELHLSQNQIGDVGAQHLATVLRKLTELRKIDLSNNSFGPMGGERLAESLALCRHLEELRLGHNVLGDPTALRLARELPPHLRVLLLQACHLSPTGLLSLGQALDGYLHVEELSLAENSLAGGVLSFCRGLPLLRQIDLVACEIDDQTAKPLAASFLLCPALEEILLSWNQLGDMAAAELALVLPQMGRLKRMDLEKNQITAHGAQLLAAGLAQAPGIQVICLWGNSISHEKVQHLQRQNPRLNFAFFDSKSQTSGDT